MPHMYICTCVADLHVCTYFAGGLCSAHVLWSQTCMYVHMYVCTYIHMYVRTYVCTYVDDLCVLCLLSLSAGLGCSLGG